MIYVKQGLIIICCCYKFNEQKPVAMSNVFDSLILPKKILVLQQIESVIEDLDARKTKKGNYIKT